MPLSIALWTDDQWGVFVTTLGAGLAAAVLVYGEIVRRRRIGGAPAGVHRKHREMSAPDDGMHLAMSPQGEAYWAADDVAEHVAPGPGSLLSLREVGPGVIAAVAPLVDDDIAESVGAALDAALAKFRADVEPAMRTARLWTLQAGETYAENALRVLRITERTGEYPLVTASH